MNIMMKWMEKKWLAWTVRIVVGGMFVYAGALKMANPVAFADSIATFKMLPEELIHVVALGLPPFEIVAGLLLITGFYMRLAAFSVVGMTAVFTLAIVQALARGLEVDCGCFGSGEPSAWKTWSTLGRDILILAAMVPLYFKELTKVSDSKSV